MNSLKTVTLVAVMAAVGYGVYSSLHKRPPAEPPIAAEDWTAGPQVQLPSTETSSPPVSLMPGTAAPPQFVNSPIGTPDSNGAATALSGSPLPGSSLPGSSPLASGMKPSAEAGGAPSGTVQASYGAGASGNPPSAMPTGPRGNEGFVVIDDHSAGADPTKTMPAAGGDIHVQFARAFDTAQVQADMGKLAEAHLELSRWYDHPELSEGETRQLVEMLDRLAGTVIYSHKHHLLEKPYQVKPGQTLQQVADEHQVPWQLLAKINGLADPAMIRAGDMLKVVRGPFNAVVDVKNYRLTLFLDGRYAGRFPIGLGREAPANTGDFEVQGVVGNPIYRGPDIVVEANDPNNPLGRVWIDLGNQWGIHGTNDPRNIGANTGRGCILMKPQDIAHVQDILTIGSRVMVRR